MNKIIEILLSASKIIGFISNIFSKIKKNEREKKDEKEQADLENILPHTDNHNN